MRDEVHYEMLENEARFLVESKDRQVSSHQDEFTELADVNYINAKGQ